MRIRKPMVTVGALAALTLSLVAPSAHAVAPAADAGLKPSGSALLHVGGDDQTAYAKKVKGKTYTVKAPADAEVAWVGVVEGKGDRSGSYTPQQLVKAWTVLGHRKGSGVQSTITWFPKGSDMMSFRSAKVSDPRINSKGELVFTATINDVMANDLPVTLPRFGINISRAGQQSRGYPIDWNREITSDFSVHGSTGGDGSGSTIFASKATGAWVDCATSPRISASGKSPVLFYLKTAFTCGAYSVATQDTYVVWAPSSYQWSMLPCWNVTWSGGSSKQCATLPMVWGSGGSKA